MSNWSFDRDILEDPKRLRELYCQQNLSMNEIAQRIGCSPSTVSRYLRKHEIEKRSLKESCQVRSNSLAKFNQSILNDPCQMRHLYQDKKLSARKIAEIVGCTKSTVFRYLKRHGIPKRSLEESQRLSQKTTQKSRKKQRDYSQSVLNDPKKLWELYDDKKLSASEIARELKCSRSSVLRYLEKHRIPKRSLSESCRLGKRKQFVIDSTILEKPEALQKLFIDDGMTGPEIAEMVGCTHRTIYFYLKKYGICKSEEERKNSQYSKSVPIPGYLKEFLVGSLLGDGHIRKGIYGSRYQLTSKHPEYIHYAKIMLEKAGYRCNVNQYTTKRKTTQFLLTTNASKQLHSLREKFYPNEEKIVPDDIELTPKVCLFWYLEDGTLASKKQRITGIHLFTISFPITDNEQLVQKLKANLNVDEGIKLAKRNYVRLNQLPALKFIEYIGENSPVKCFEYKFNPKLRAK
ncbi:MAG: helix-turn-helix domain-containing protein [Candidatus Hodarchaeales archaeon]|jgi:transcriptional regulator with XRE-family HTH domain